MDAHMQTQKHIYDDSRAHTRTERSTSSNKDTYIQYCVHIYTCAHTNTLIVQNIHTERPIVQYVGHKIETQKMWELLQKVTMKALPIPQFTLNIHQVTQSHFIVPQSVSIALAPYMRAQGGATAKVSEWPPGWLPDMPTYGCQTDKFLQEQTWAASKRHWGGCSLSFFIFIHICCC